MPRSQHHARPASRSLARANHYYRFTWVDGDQVIEQDIRIIAADRPDLFPPAEDWHRLDLPGGLILFVQKPLA